MLNKLLELLRTGGTHQVADLAHKLESTPPLVEMMLEDLARMGYLKQVNGECAGQCSACSLAGLCTTGEGKRVWTLTEKEHKTAGDDRVE
jgi:predicted ArsR family transcriptional regulator